MLFYTLNRVQSEENKFETGHVCYVFKILFNVFCLYPTYDSLRKGAKTHAIREFVTALKRIMEANNWVL